MLSVTVKLGVTCIDCAALVAIDAIHASGRAASCASMLDVTTVLESRVPRTMRATSQVRTVIDLKRRCTVFLDTL